MKLTGLYQTHFLRFLVIFQECEHLLINRLPFVLSFHESSLVRVFSFDRIGLTFKGQSDHYITW